MGASRPHRILVVDDEPDALRILMHILQSGGYEVVPAYGGADALRKIERYEIDLVLTDLAMPKVSGVEVVERIKKDPKRRHIPVIAVTAYTWDYIAQSAGQAGCDGFISKPCRGRQLLQEIQKFLGPGTGNTQSD